MLDVKHIQFCTDSESMMCISIASTRQNCQQKSRPHVWLTSKIWWERGLRRSISNNYMSSGCYTQLKHCHRLTDTCSFLVVLVVVANLECCRNMMRFVVDVDARITFAVPPTRRQSHLTRLFSLCWKIILEHLYCTCLSGSKRVAGEGGKAV